MGGKQSEAASMAVATTCLFEKDAFNHQLDYIRDANTVCQFYAKLLLTEGELPVKLDKYLNYSSATEEYFNGTRKEVKSTIGMSYYQFYQSLEKLKYEYESPSMTQNKRRQMLVDIFNKSYGVQQSLIEDLWSSCDKYGLPSEPIESSASSSASSSTTSSEVGTTETSVESSSAAESSQKK